MYVRAGVGRAARVCRLGVSLPMCVLGRCGSTPSVCADRVGRLGELGRAYPLGQLSTRTFSYLTIWFLPLRMIYLEWDTGIHFCIRIDGCVCQKKTCVFLFADLGYA